MDNQKRTVVRTGTHACGDTSCGGASVPSNVSQKQESPAFRRGERSYQEHAVNKRRAREIWEKLGIEEDK